MSTQRKLRKEKQMAQTNPINVTVIVDGIKKVISWKEYKEFLGEKLKEGEGNGE